MCLVSTFRGDDAWFVNEIHAAMAIISINRSINLIMDYFSNQLINFNRLIVAALTDSK